MPAPEYASLYQRAIVWRAAGSDQFGQPAVGLPVEMPVRWNTTSRESLSKDGNTVYLDATLITFLEIPIGSQTWLGTLAEYNALPADVNLTDHEIMEVKTVSSTPDLKARVFMRSYGLMRLRNTK